MIFAPTDRTPAERAAEHAPVLDTDDLDFAADKARKALARLMKPGRGAGAW